MAQTPGPDHIISIYYQTDDGINRSYPIDLIPPVGTRIRIEKHLHDGGSPLLVEVTENQWELIPGDEGDESAMFEVSVKTRRIKPGIAF